MSTLWLIPTIIWPNITKVYTAFIGLILWASSLASLSYYGIYKQDFSQSVLFVLFESNASEGMEYIQSYFSYWLLIGLLTYTIIGFVAWYKLPTIKRGKPAALISCLIISYIVFYPFLLSTVVSHSDVDRALVKQ